MPESPRVESPPFSANKFSRKIMKEVRNLGRCYQCSACSDGCPVAYTMDYHPNQIIHMVQLGLKEKVLESRAIWICLSCETCTTHCPNEIDIVRLMDVLRREALQKGLKIPVKNIPAFHKIFMEQIRKRGRIDEAGLLLSYKLRTASLLSLNKVAEEACLGLRMLRKGKLRLPPLKVQKQKEVEEIFKKALPNG